MKEYNTKRSEWIVNIINYNIIILDLHNLIIMMVFLSYFFSVMTIILSRK
jgi:hypothetical protein